ncbi:MAG: efflux RND transporter periplasmic adaptor subunit [Acidobacteria bacterium]|nr:efflux RND transporter periplasmic adaptor subunit [Acidobacteriota bacterium]MBV8894374.1 efflux RND transporter periplasmic adaptor subunit [Acidobacteriota bacterium]MBV9481079.1 efflux RND transporter periplasmic adaptor subunit [Acidobacteriota bacterium]
MAALNKGGAGFFARNRWWIVAIAIMFAVVLFAAFNSMAGGVIPVRADHVRTANIRSVISTNGKVEPISNFEAHSPVATTVKSVLVREGDHVKRGQLLLQLDDAEARTSAAKAVAELKGAQADINAAQTGGTREEVLTAGAQLVKARAERDNAQRNFEALERLEKNGAASIGEVKEAEAQFNTAQASVNVLEQKLRNRYSKPEVAHIEAQKGEAQAAYDAAADILNKSNVKAPFDGVVYSVPVHAGNYVNPGDLLLQEADLSQVRVRAFVDEPDVGRLAPGERIEITWDAVPGRIWQGQLLSVPATVKLLGSRNVGEITAHLNNSDFKLLPNTNVTVQIITAEHKNVLVVPREALRTDDNTPYVYRIVDDQLRRQPVRTSIVNLTQAEVSQGLSDNQLVALGSPSPKPLRDNQPVKVVQ